MFNCLSLQKKLLQTNATLKKKGAARCAISDLHQKPAPNPEPEMPAEAMTRIASKAKVVPQTVKMGLGKLLASVFRQFLLGITCGAVRKYLIGWLAAPSQLLYMHINLIILPLPPSWFSGKWVQYFPIGSLPESKTAMDSTEPWESYGRNHMVGCLPNHICRWQVIQVIWDVNKGPNCNKGFNKDLSNELFPKVTNQPTPFDLGKCQQKKVLNYQSKGSSEMPRKVFFGTSQVTGRVHLLWSLPLSCPSLPEVVSILILLLIVTPMPPDTTEGTAC